MLPAEKNFPNIKDKNILYDKCIAAFLHPSDGPKSKLRHFKFCTYNNFFVEWWERSLATEATDTETAKRIVGEIKFVPFCRDNSDARFRPSMSSTNTQYVFLNQFIR